VYAYNSSVPHAADISIDLESDTEWLEDDSESFSRQAETGNKANTNTNNNNSNNKNNNNDYNTNIMAVRKKQDDKYLLALRELVNSGAGNRQCFDCNQKGPTYVNMTIGSFVCTRCSGVL